MQNLLKVLGLKELGLVVGGVMLLGFVSVSVNNAATQAAGFQNIVAIAQAIEQGRARAIPQAHWNGGKVPYLWCGGHGSTPGPSLAPVTCSKGPSPYKGVDCSGFVRWVYSIAFGSDVLGSGSTINEIALPKLQPVTAAAAVPGDLVFFGVLSSPHHVGIYIGNGQMINALQPGTDIRTDHLLSDLVGYYHYQGGIASSTQNLPRSELVNIAQIIADQYGLPLLSQYFTKQINRENGFRVSGTSKKHAMGIAQFISSTAQTWRVDPADPLSSLEGAARMMATRYCEYLGLNLPSGVPEQDVLDSSRYGGAQTYLTLCQRASAQASPLTQIVAYNKALVAYDAGPGKVGLSWQALPGETQGYIQNITGIELV